MASGRCARRSCRRREARRSSTMAYRTMPTAVAAQKRLEHPANRPKPVDVNCSDGTFIPLTIMATPKPTHTNNIHNRSRRDQGIRSRTRRFWGNWSVISALQIPTQMDSLPKRMRPMRPASSSRATGVTYDLLSTPHSCCTRAVHAYRLAMATRQEAVRVPATVHRSDPGGLHPQGGCSVSLTQLRVDL